MGQNDSGEKGNGRESRPSIAPGAQSGVSSQIERELQTRTVEKTRFDFDPTTGLIRWRDGTEEPFQLIVDGLVEEPVSFSYYQLNNLPQTMQISDFHCVEGWSVLNNLWEGIRCEEIFKHVKIKQEAKFAIFHALGETDYIAQGLNHYIECLPISDLVNPDKEIILALKLERQPLSIKRGSPLRLVTPYDLAYKSIKFVNRIELSKKEIEGWWTVANPIYPMHAPVPKSRLRKK